MNSSRLSCVAVLLIALTAPGCLFADVVTPLDIDVNVTGLGDKEGRANAYSILWLFSWGDRGTKAAAENGGLTVVNHMDIQNVVVLFGLYVRQTTIVYGE